MTAKDKLTKLKKEVLARLQGKEIYVVNGKYEIRRNKMNKELEEAIRIGREFVKLHAINKEHSKILYIFDLISKAFSDMERNFEIQLKLNKVLGDERDELQATIDKVEEVVRGGFQREEIEDKIKEILKEE